jgi:hypothetical protein
MTIARDMVQDRVMAPDPPRVTVPDRNRVMAPDPPRVTVPDRNRAMDPDQDRATVPDRNRAMARADVLAMGLAMTVTAVPALAWGVIAAMARAVVMVTIAAAMARVVVAAMVRAGVLAMVPAMTVTAVPALAWGDAKPRKKLADTFGCTTKPRV